MIFSKMFNRMWIVFSSKTLNFLSCNYFLITLKALTHLELFKIKANPPNFINRFTINITVCEIFRQIRPPYFIFIKQEAFLLVER